MSNLKEKLKGALEADREAEQREKEIREKLLNSQFQYETPKLKNESLKDKEK